MNEDVPLSSLVLWCAEYGPAPAPPVEATDGNTEGGADGNGQTVAHSVGGPMRGDTRAHPLVQWFQEFTDTEELAKLVEARRKVCLFACAESKLFFTFCTLHTV